MAGVVAYWAEGAKTTRVQFSNSDPALLALFLRWAMTYLDVSADDFTIRLHLHGGQDEDESKLFWAAITGLGLDQFRKTFVKAEGTGHRKKLLYRGTAAVSLRRSGSQLLRVLGWIDAFRADLPRIH